ncbi:MAG TPA: barstar family protein, partial [Halomicronema sp.]
VFYLDGKEITNKQTFLKQAGETLKFPAYYGQNWDAFNDCITDLKWCPARAYILIYDQPEIFAKAEPDQWQIALTILNSTVEYWQEKSIPMDIFLLN